MFSRPPLSTLFPYTTLFDLPYEVAAVVEIQPVGRGVRMVVTEDAMHDELWTERSTMGMNSSLDRLAKVLEARLGKRSEERRVGKECGGGWAEVQYRRRRRTG